MPLSAMSKGVFVSQVVIHRSRAKVSIFMASFHGVRSVLYTSRPSGRNDIQPLRIRSDHGPDGDAAIEGGQPAVLLGGEPEEVDVGDLPMGHSRKLEAILVAQR